MTVSRLSSRTPRLTWFAYSKFANFSERAGMVRLERDGEIHKHIHRGTVPPPEQIAQNGHTEYTAPDSALALTGPLAYLITRVFSSRSFMHTLHTAGNHWYVRFCIHAYITVHNERPQGDDEVELRKNHRRIQSMTAYYGYFNMWCSSESYLTNSLRNISCSSSGGAGAIRGF